MKAGINHVLIRPDADNDRLWGLLLGTTWDEQRVWSVFGTVVAPPGRLFFHALTGILEVDQFLNAVSLPWDTDCELKTGDRVVFRYNIRMDEDGVFEDGDGLLLLVPYDSVYARIQGEELIPVNGWLILEGDTVKAAGLANRRYLHFPEREDEDVEVGARVMVHPHRRVRIETPEHSQMGELDRIQRKEILLYEK